MYRVCLFALSLLVAAGGCRPTPAARDSDPAQAREALAQALDAWKKGDSLPTFQGANPALTVVDRQWKAGAKLLNYELGAGAPNGFDIQFTVTLTLQDASGKKGTEKATYIVSTNPALVVIRSEAGG